MKKDNGITLVALIVVIILLLILAGIGITVLTQTELLKKTKEAKQIVENTQIEEKTILSNYEDKINTTISGNREQIIIDKDEYDTLKKNSEYEKYENLEDLIELKSNVKILDGEIKRQGKLVNINLFIEVAQVAQADIWTEIGRLKNEELIPETEEWGYLAQGTNGGNFVVTKEGIIKFRGKTSSTRYWGNIVYFSK